MNLYEVAKQAVENGCQAIRLRKPAQECAGCLTAEATDKVNDCCIEQYDCKPWSSGNKRGWILFDSFTASAVKQIYENLNEENKVKYLALPLNKFIKVTWKGVV